MVDHSSRESVLLLTGFGLTNLEVIMTLDRGAQSLKLPVSIVVDYSGKFTSFVMDNKAHVNCMSLAFTRPGKPADN